MVRTEFLDKINYIMFNNVFENRTVLEIMCRSQITRWCMRIACWIPRLQRHTCTLRICNSYCFFTVSLVARKHLIACFMYTLTLLLPFTLNSYSKLLHTILIFMYVVSAIDIILQMMSPNKERKS